MITIEGYVNKIIYHNKENNYFILSIFLNKEYEFIDNDYISVVGTFDNIEFKEEDLYEFKGNIVSHKKYGNQLSAITAEIVIKKNKEHIINYLSSSTFKGVGKKTAEIIVNELGVDCLEKIYENKDNLFKIKSINNKRKEIIYNAIISNKHTQDIILKLTEYNINPNLITKIYSKYKSKTLEIINNNPYYLIDDIKGISFNTVDKIAEKIGVNYNDKERIAAGIVYTLSIYCYSNGHTYMKKNNLLYNSFNILYNSRKEQINKEDIIDALTYCIEENKLYAVDDNIFLTEIFTAEFNIFNNIENRLNEIENHKINNDIFNTHLKEIEKELNIKYDISQIEAIKNSINEKFSIITGGPGTGKTTIILAIIKMFQKTNNYSHKDLINEETKIITLCAPTGKAAKRMTESTGFLSTTIHKAIGWSNEDENMNEFISDRYINSKIVIIDEASMIDVFLMNNLLKIINKNSKIIIVGDDNQLPSIAPGNVLNDLIKSKKIPTISLNKIFRQKNESSIINLSHSIKNNINIDILENYKDREFLITEKIDIIETINKIYKQLLNITKKDKIQILAPIYKTNYGINAINKSIQENFNDSNIFIEYGENIFKINDRVMQLINRPENNIFNGDIGIIHDIYKEDNIYKIVINFDENLITYEKQELNQITLSYACSIHKSQGSEFDYVIIPLIDNYNFMLNKNLVYTAITRTRKKLFLCGNPNVFYSSIDANNILVRDSFLEKFFKKNKTEIIEIEKSYILTPNNIKFIEPMIGMENITPYDNYIEE